MFDFLHFFNLVHPDSACESNPETYLEKAIFDILRNNVRGRIFRCKKGKIVPYKVGFFFAEMSHYGYRF